MKKILFLIAIFLLVCLTTTVFAQKNRTLSNGFSISLVTGFPSINYGLTKDAQIDAADKLGGIWGIKLGNRWYF
jgi:hypothetical protein